MPFGTQLSVRARARARTHRPPERQPPAEPSPPPPLERSEDAFAVLLGPELGMLAELGVAALATDLEGTVRYCAGDAAKLLGSAPEELLGSAIADTELGSIECPLLRSAISELKRRGRWEGALALSEDGAGVRVRATVLRDGAGEPVGYAAVLLDGDARGDTQTGASAAEAALWQTTLDAVPAHTAMLDETGRIIAVNEAWRSGAERDSSGRYDVGASYVAVCEGLGGHIAAEAERLIAETLAGSRERFELEYPCGSEPAPRWFQARARRLQGVESTRVVIVREDVTAFRRADEQAATQAALVRQMDAAIVITDMRGRVQSWNAGAERLYGYTAEEAVGRHVGELIVPDEQRAALDSAALLRDGVYDGAATGRRKDGALVDVFIHQGLIRDQEGRPTAIVGVSGETSNGAQLAREAGAARNHLRAVSQSMAEAMYTFDRSGHLIEMNPAARDLLGWSAEDFHGRTMGEMLLERPDSREGCPVERACERGETVKVAEERFRCSDGRLLPVTYTAAPIVTGEGTDGCVIVFEDISERKAHDEELQRELDALSWVARIQEALVEERFLLHAQPIVDMSTGATTQWELLLRMLPTDGEDLSELVPPGCFLPAAEQHGLIREIDRWVLGRAAELAAGGAAVQVNLSGRSVSDPALAADVQAALERTGADPRLLVFEITETTLVTDEQAATRFVEQMHSLGCRIALDDFGTGYGTFTYLKHLPIDYLKVDIEFVRDLAENPASRKVVTAIVSLAESFGLMTIGEGVEDEHTLTLLRELGVDYAQGFHLGRPGPLASGPQPR